MAWRMRKVCDRIAAFPGPVLAALNGHALGGGAEVAVAADIRLAADDVKIGFNQVALEIMPAWGGAERLSALVGKSQALLLAGTGAVLSAADAERVGLIQRVVPRESFEDEWRAVARKLAATPVEAIKRVIAGTTKDDAVSSFASLWVSDAHWAAADKVMNRGK
jgi:enoyl-CoA hydratase